ncbi:MAG: DUF1513 domain-containing protein [Bacteriovoracia bacterium]
MDRRDFLKTTVLLAVPGLLLEGCAHFNFSEPSSSGDVLLLPMVGSLGIYRPKIDELRFIAVPNVNTHSVVPNPARPREVLVLDQVETHASLVDIAQERLLATCSPVDGFVFSGHGCISADGRYLFLCENHKDNQSPSVKKKIPGHITVRDASSLQVLRTIPAHGAWAHNVMFMRGESILAVGYQATEGAANEPKRGAEMLFLSASEGAILERFVPPDTHWSLNHFDFTHDDKIIVAAQTTYVDGAKASGDLVIKDLVAPVLMGKPGQKNWTQNMPPSLASSMIRNHTVFVDRERRRALVAHQLGGHVSVWDTDKEQLISALEIDNPQGICATLDGRYYVVVNKEKTIIFLEAETLKISRRIDGRNMSRAGLDGPQHIAMIKGGASV